MWCSRETCGLSRGNYLHISPHLPTNNCTNKHVNTDIKFYIKLHIQQVMHMQTHTYTYTWLILTYLFLLGWSYTHMHTINLMLSIGELG